MEMVAISGQQYAPKTSVLINGEMVTFRLLERSDEEALKEFFRRITEREADTLRDDVRAPDTICNWISTLDYGRALPLVATSEHDHHMAGVGTLHFRTGVHRHMADIRIFVSEPFRKLGLGSAMIKEQIELGRQRGIVFLRAEILAENQLAIRAFRQLGFEVKCTLEEYFMTLKGDLKDVVLMLKRLQVNMEEDFFYVF